MLIQCRDVSFAYDGKTVIQELNFTVERGDYLCIVGENGSGKSTLVKGLLQLKSPQSGQITIEKNQRIGYLPQQNAVQADFPASVLEVVRSGCLAGHGLRPYYNTAEKSRSRENMEKLGIWNLRRQSFRDLSGGQQQRVLLTRALCATDSLLLLDEPAAGLDPVITAEFYTLISQLNKDSGLTIVMVSHDIHSAVHHASKILHLKNTQVFFGNTADYLQTESGQHFLACANLDY